MKKKKPTNTEIWSLEEKKIQSFEDQRKKVHKTLSPPKQKNKTKNKKKNMAVSASHELSLLRCVY